MRNPEAIIKDWKTVKMSNILIHNNFTITAKTNTNSFKIVVVDVHCGSL